MLRLRIFGLVVFPEEKVDILREKAASLLRVPIEDILALKVVKKSLDARSNRRPFFSYVIDISLSGEARPDCVIGSSVKIETAPEEEEPKFDAVAIEPAYRPVVIGCGPSGLFAALALVKRKLTPIILERGKSILERIEDVRSFWENSVLDPESNVYFGEGGAGTFSDGKLTSRAKEHRALWIKRILVEMGAPAEIITEAKPHIGTDRLRAVLINLRKKLTDEGCEFRFQSKVTDFLIFQGRIQGVLVNGEEEIRTNHVILAVGQNADDVYENLYRLGVQLVPKPFAIGLRVEHPQELINKIQYGRWSAHYNLPPAEYALTARADGGNRSVYSFCMCPGGYIVGCATDAEHLVTNGMSYYRRDGTYANSAVVVNISAEDFLKRDSTPLEGLHFRKRWEKKAFIMGGGRYFAPAQRLTDFLRDKESLLPVSTSYSPGVKLALLRDVLPEFVIKALKEGFHIFDKKMRGFISDQAILIGVETRTSSPVRILRNYNCQSVNIVGLYPCGEGAGYAGGIISSAIDGIRVAENIIP